MEFGSSGFSDESDQWKAAIMSLSWEGLSKTLHDPNSETEYKNEEFFLNKWASVYFLSK